MPAPVTDPAGYAVRLAAPRDLRHLAGVEAAADAVLLEHLGGPDPSDWSPPTDGRDRDLAPGFLLVAVQRDGVRAGSQDDALVGFAHVLDVDGDAHLEQLAVHPAHARRGIGTALVRAALEESRWRGHERLSLATYRDVPFNAPFYARLGFTEVDRPRWWQRDLLAHERALGLEEHGPRVLMEIGLGGGRTRRRPLVTAG